MVNIQASEGHDDGYEDRPAPGRLERVRVLLNSDNRYYGFDHFDDPPRLVDHLRRHDVLVTDDPVDESALRRLRTFRDTLRAHVVSPDDETSRRLAEIADRHPFAVRLSPTGTRLVPLRGDDGVDLAIASALDTVHHAVVDDTWSRLRTCGRPDCQWVYFDSSRNRSARWCSGYPCGDVMKTRAWRARRRSAPDGSS